MSYAYMVRITHSYQDASGVVALWAARAQKMVVYEHVGSQTEKIHIHLVIVGSDTHKKQLRNIGMATGLALKGNKFCSFKEFKGEDRCYVYMTKGVHDPSFVKGYGDNEIARWKSLWEDEAKQTTDAKIYHYVFGDTEYLEASYDEYMGGNPRTDSTRWHFIKGFVRQMIFNHNLSIWNLRAINLYKMCVYTYCYRNGLTIPDKDPVFKVF